jgi:hemerythrin-like domain-containing protein
MVVVQIGRKTPATDFVGMLLECHGRIRTFSATARRLGEATDVPPEQVREAAHSVRRYFDEALPQHVEDEEETVVPRLRGRDAELDVALERMSREHSAHEPALSALLSLCRRLEATPEQHAELRDELSAVATALEQELGAHLAHEEATIIAAIPRLLSSQEQAVMIEELRHRRRRT